MVKKFKGDLPGKLPARTNMKIIRGCERSNNSEHGPISLCFLSRFICRKVSFVTVFQKCYPLMMLSRSFFVLNSLFVSENERKFVNSYFYRLSDGK